jgi:hypothetical protein
MVIEVGLIKTDKEKELSEVADEELSEVADEEVALLTFTTIPGDVHVPK